MMPIEKENQHAPPADPVDLGGVDAPATNDDQVSADGLSKDEYPHGFRLVLIMVALVLSMFLVALDMTIVSTAIPSITDTDGFRNLDQIGWYGSAFFLTLATFQSTWGKLYNFFSLKLVFLASVLMFEVGSFLSAGVSPNSTALIIGRAVTGCGAAGIVSGCYIIIAFVTPPSTRAGFTGLIGAVFGVASVAGPLLGGFFSDKVTWRWCFYINLPIGGAAMVLIVLFFRTPSAAQPSPTTLMEKLRSFDFIGLLLVHGAFVLLLLDLQWGGTTKAWSSGTMIGTLVACAILTILFVANEIWQGEQAMMMPRLLTRRVVAGACLYVFLQSGANFVFTYYLPIYFQAIGSLSAADSGIHLLPLIVGSSILAISSGLILQRVGYFTPLLVLGSALFALGSGLTYSIGIGTPAANYLGYQVLLGVGQGLAIQVPVIIGQAFSEPQDIPAVTATILFFQMAGGGIFVSVAQSIFSNLLLGNLVGGIDRRAVLETGAHDLRRVFSGPALDGVLRAYMAGLGGTFALGLALGLAAFLAAFLPPMWSIKRGEKIVPTMA